MVPAHCSFTCALAALLPTLVLCNPCGGGQTFQCPDGSRPSGHPPCSGGRPQCCTGGSCTDAPRPGSGPAPRPAPGPAPPGPGGGGGGGPGAKPCANPTCSAPPCAARLLGDVGCTTVSGIEEYDHELVKKGDTISSNAHIYGPFEAGFTDRQKSIIQGWGCADPSVTYDSEGGTDIDIAEKRVAHLCKLQFPRLVGNRYFGIVSACGGHTHDYHFHRAFKCLYKESGGHSPAVGKVAQWKIYGKWEDYANQRLPYLDACGAHFGSTPDSGGANVYHYQVQDKPPHSVGCHGPAAGNKLVSVAVCRSLYTRGGRSGGCNDAPVNLEVGNGQSVSYARFCPCYDADGSNTGTIRELPALSASEISYIVGATTVTSASTTSTTATIGGGTSIAGSPTVGATATATTVTTTMPTTTVTTALVLSGGLMITVPDASSFKSDVDAQNALKTGIAAVFSVSSAHVILDIKARRLLSPEGRRLAESVNVGYTIYAPSVSVLAEVTKKADSLTVTEISTAIIKEVKAKKGPGYDIKVSKIVKGVVPPSPSATSGATGKPAPSPPAATGKPAPSPSSGVSSANSAQALALQFRGVMAFAFVASLLASSQ